MGLTPLTSGTCRCVVEDAEVVFAFVTSSIVGATARIPDDDDGVVRVLAAALASDLDDRSHETLAAVLVLPLPVVAADDTQTHCYTTAG